MTPTTTRSTTRGRIRPGPRVRRPRLRRRVRGRHRPRLRRGTADEDVAGRRRPGPKHHPARDRRRSRLQPPCAAAAAVRRGAMRRLHGLRQRLPGQRARRDGRARGGRPDGDRRASPRAGRAGDERHDLRGQFVRTKKYAEVPERNGIAPGAFGLFVEPTHCKGCGECVEVCAALGHDALFMTDKVEREPAGASTIDGRRDDDARSCARCRRHRGLSERQGAGRPHARRARLRLRRRRRLLRRLRRGDRDPDDGRGDAAGPWRGHRWGSWRRPAAIPSSAARTRSTRTSSRGRTRCSRMPRRSRPGSGSTWDQEGHADRRLWVMGGDGAMYDIGFQALSRMVASGADIKVLVLDTQVYSNTGGQASTASFGGQVTKLSAFGAAQHGRPESPQGAGAHPDGPRRRLCRPDDAGAREPLLPVDPGGQRVPRPGRDHRLRGVHARARHRRRRRQSPGAARGRLAGIPAVHLRPAARAAGSAIGCRCRAIRRSARTGRRTPAGEPVDFLSFARTRGPVRAALRSVGEPTTEILATNADRLANWHTLQELAGIRSTAAEPRTA